MQTKLIDVDTSRRRVADLTREVAAFCRENGSGLCNVFVPHATAGVAIIELGAGSDTDLLNALGDLLPRDDRWSHRHGSPGHGADHVLPAFIAPSITVPSVDGQPALGTWQSIALIDTNQDNPHRHVRLSFISG